MSKFDYGKFTRVLKKLIETSGAYAPLEIGQFRTGDQRERQPDFEISFLWRNRETHFSARIQLRTAPRNVQKTLSTIDRQGDNMLLALPYLSSSIVNLLEETNVSGIDLNGNYVLQTEDFVAIQLDKKNKYKESGGIKNVFRGTSSIVCRYLLQNPGPHETVTAIHTSIRDWDGRVSMSTVSKVLSTLNDELIVEKGNCIQVLQPDKLLQNLRDEYRRPQTVQSIPLALPEARQDKEAILTEMLGNGLWVWGAGSSAERYATTTPSQEHEVYVRELPLNNGIDAYKDERFYNCILHESREDFVYFGHDKHWASEIQTYLELVNGDKREREIAHHIKQRILHRFS